MTQTQTDQVTHANVLAFQATLATINLSDVPRDNALDRHCSRKVLAAAARKLFKSLGLKGISVTAPRYSMAQAVDIGLPRREDYTFDQFGMVAEGDVARAANNVAHRKIADILYAAFPSHRDRSDSQSDHFDYKWSIQ